jgi:hypothetical protein
LALRLESALAAAEVVVKLLAALREGQELLGLAVSYLMVHWEQYLAVLVACQKTVQQAAVAHR